MVHPSFDFSDMHQCTKKKHRGGKKKKEIDLIAGYVNIILS